MDIISHTLTGVAVGTVVANTAEFGWKRKASTLLIGGLGGALPDLDAITLWSRFDTTIGQVLNLQHSGHTIYFGRFWYSHHAAMHSLLAPFLILLVFFSLRALVTGRLSASALQKQLLEHKYLSLAFLTGFIFHLLEDMPTPASVWGGVNLFFPSRAYFGGFGKIWWWNNYDLVLIIVSVIALNLVVLALPRTVQRLKRWTSLCVFALGAAVFIFQINARTVDFGYSGHTPNYDELELKSKRIQKDILGNELFEMMSVIDDHIPLYF